MSDSQQAQDTGLLRVIGFPHATAMVVGTVIGAGSDYPHLIGRLDQVVRSLRGSTNRTKT